MSQRGCGQTCGAHTAHHIHSEKQDCVFKGFMMCICALNKDILHMFETKCPGALVAI